MKSLRLLVCALSLTSINQACDSSKDDNSSGGGQAYDFSSTASARIQASDTGLSLTTDTSGPQHVCENSGPITCTGPSAMSGKYYSVGLLIQAGGSGMMSYLLSDAWSEITSDSTTYDFDMEDPITSSGELICCGGQGDLNSGNTYFSNGAFLFGYMDMTFKVPYTSSQLSQVSEEMKADHTVRFVMAADVITGYERGDLLLKDTDGSFKWMDSNGNLSSTRPSSPITMNSEVVNFEQPFEGFESEIPVIYTEIQDNADGKITTSEAELKEADKTYTFNYDPSYAIVFMLDPSEMTIIQSKKEMLSRIHLQGLPHSNFGGFGAAAISDLSID